VTTETAFYSFCDHRHFVGFVALMNSLRLVGHEERIVLVDAGLLPAQRRLVERHVTVVDAPEGKHVILLKQHGPTVAPADVMVLLDSDVIVVRSLSELVLDANRGQIVAFMDNGSDASRFFPQWSKELALPELRRYPYVNAGQLFVPHSLANRLFPPWAQGQSRINLARAWHTAQRDDSNPFYFGDQDVLNAVMAAYLDPDELRILDNELAPNPPFPGLRLVDEFRLHCSYEDGTRPYVLHHFLAKPWLSTTPATVYSRLVTRLVLAPDVRLQLPPSSLPLRMRHGYLAAVDRFRATWQARTHSSVRRHVGALGVRTRIAGGRRAHS
jgi:hypothetical protein